MNSAAPGELVLRDPEGVTGLLDIRVEEAYCFANHYDGRYTPDRGTHASDIFTMGEETTGPPQKRRVPGLSERITAVIEGWMAQHGVSGVLAFSKRAGISDTAVAAYMSGEKEPGAYALWRLAAVTGTSPAYLLNGGDRPVQAPTATRQARSVIAALRQLPQYGDLPRDAQRRYRDRLSYIEMQVRRLVFDAEQFLAELHAQAQRVRFDAEEFRREWTAGEDEDDG